MRDLADARQRFEALWRLKRPSHWSPAIEKDWKRPRTERPKLQWYKSRPSRDWLLFLTPPFLLSAWSDKHIRNRPRRGLKGRFPQEAAFVHLVDGCILGHGPLPEGYWAAALDGNPQCHFDRQLTRPSRGPKRGRKRLKYLIAFCFLCSTAMKDFRVRYVCQMIFAPLFVHFIS